MKIKKIRKRRGITMIELLVVLVIVGSIIGILVNNMIKSQKQASGKLNKLKMQMDWAKLNAALLDYSRVYGKYPDSNAGLEALVNPPETESGNAAGSFIDRDSILDQWKNPYHYELTDNGFKIMSLGSDGTIGGDGINADVDLSTLQ